MSSVTCNNAEPEESVQHMGIEIRRGRESREGFKSRDTLPSRGVYHVRV